MELVPHGKRAFEQLRKIQSRTRLITAALVCLQIKSSNSIYDDINTHIIIQLYYNISTIDYLFFVEQLNWTWYQGFQEPFVSSLLQH